MDQSEFYQDLRQIDEEMQRRGVSPVSLSASEVQEIDTRVYADISTLYPIDETTEQTGLLTTVKKYLPASNDDRFGFPVAGVAAMLGVLMIGGLMLGQSMKSPTGVPASIATANLHQHVHLPVGGMAAITDANLTDRRDAYLAGYAKANLYAIGESDPVKAQNFAIWYLETTGISDAQQNPLSSFQHEIEGYLGGEATEFWYNQGLATELVQLAAKGAMFDLDTDVLRDAIRFYNESSESLSDHIGPTDQRYFDKHRELLDLPTPSTPGELQQIIDTTQAMIILIK